MPGNVRVNSVERLEAAQRSSLLRLTRAAEHLDGTAPLSEQVLLSARDRSRTPSPPSHFLAYDGTQLVGYAHLERGPAAEPATAEVVVDPGHRRQGTGTALVHALETALGAGGQIPEPEAETLRLWSHGHLDVARAFAVRDGYSKVRELWVMRRPLADAVDPLPPVSLPEGFMVRDFVVGQDEEAWLRVNARAFADHAEQGRMTRHDLDQRIAEPWFNAAGLILIEDTRGGAAGVARNSAPVLAASHWTKVVPPQDPQVSPTLGEVYVVGVDPAYQGLGLGRAVTILGLAHLRDRGLTEAMLYVDADNAAAVATYSRLDFTRSAVDVMYSRIVHPRV